VTPPAAAPAGKVAPAQPGVLQRVGEGTWGATKSVGRGIRNVGIAAGIGIPLGAGLAVEGASKILERPANPYQYGMNAPQTWNFPQQM
jgi:hypothetical protein